MSILTITDLSQQYGEKLLYRHASLTLNKGDHMGVVGQNGTGKSTLLKIVTGEVIPDGGRVQWHPGVTPGVLDQYAQVDGGLTIAQYLKTAFSGLYAIQQEMQELYTRASQTDDPAVLLLAAQKQDALEAAGFYTVENDMNRVSHGLGLSAFGMDTPLRKLSGGQRAKAILARLLLQKPPVLLLDEPTNFLDAEHIDWLAGFLSDFAGATMVVSHDFQFLERITNCICDIEGAEIYKYHGVYSEFLRQKENRREDYIRRYQAQTQMIEKTQEYIRRNKAGVNAKMARGRQKQLDRIQRLAPPSFLARPSFRFRELPRPPQTALTLDALEVGYRSALLPCLDLVLEPGKKMAITGFNGIGKSTLLKTLVGLLPPVGGAYRFSESSQIGYYEQELSWEDDSLTPLQILSRAHPSLPEKELRRCLSQSGVTAGHAMQEIRTLSGGEQSKVKLCNLFLTPHNFLILDEPTNHLDAATKDVLKSALQAFGGNVILVSHEESFYQGWTDAVLGIETLLHPAGGVSSVHIPAKG